jgi:hypothetical protein
MNFFTIGGVGVMQLLTGGIVSGTAADRATPAVYSHIFAFYGITLAVSVAVYLFSRDVKPR